jgi:hypothetical protein
VDQGYFYSKDTINRCNPRLVYHMDIKRWGFPYYNHCNFEGNKFGLYDPPAAVPTVDALLPPSTKTTTPGSVRAPPSTKAVAEPIALSTVNSGPVSKKAPVAPTSPQYNVPSADNTGAAQPVVSNIAEVLAGANQPIPSGIAEDPPGTHIPPPERSEASQLIVSNIVENLPMVPVQPTPSLMLLGTVAGQIISAAPGGDFIVVSSQTVSRGGGLATVSDVVISLGNHGVEIQSPGGGVTTMAAPSSPVNTVASDVIGKVPTQAVSKVPVEAPVTVTGAAGKVLTVISPASYSRSTQIVVTADNGIATTITVGNATPTLTHSPTSPHSLIQVGTGTTPSSRLGNAGINKMPSTAVNAVISTTGLVQKVSNPSEGAVECTLSAQSLKSILLFSGGVAFFIVMIL